MVHEWDEVISYGFYFSYPLLLSILLYTYLFTVTGFNNIYDYGYTNLLNDKHLKKVIQFPVAQLMSEDSEHLLVVTSCPSIICRPLPLLVLGARCARQGQEPHPKTAQPSPAAAPATLQPVGATNPKPRASPRKALSRRGAPRRRATGSMSPAASRIHSSACR